MGIYKGQEYKQGIILQRSNLGSAFQEKRNIIIEQEESIDEKLPAGIKEIIVSTSIIEGEPLHLDELPVAEEKYSGVVAIVNNIYFVCLEDSEGNYAWYEYVPANTNRGRPIIFNELPVAEEKYLDRIGYNLSDNTYYICEEDGEGGYVWNEMIITLGLALMTCDNEFIRTIDNEVLFSTEEGEDE